MNEFYKEYLTNWTKLDKGYEEAYKLWLWYNYQCELYDNRICTGSNKYEEYMPANLAERGLSNRNALRNCRIINEKRKLLISEGIVITQEDWEKAKHSFRNFKLKGLEEEYKHYFEIVE